MIYKGGLKNYSRGDWLLVKILIGAMIVAIIGGLLVGKPHGSSSATAVSGDARYRIEAQRQGYTGKDADDVAQAAKKLCQNTGGSGC